MPDGKKNLVRVVVPLVIIGVSGVMLALMARNALRSKPPTPSPAVASQPEQRSPGSPPPSNAGSAPPSGPIVQGSAAPAPAWTGLAARIVPEPERGTGSWAGISDDAHLKVEFTPLGAGIESVTVLDHQPSPGATRGIVLQSRRSVAYADGTIGVVVPMGAMSAQVNGTWIGLVGSEALPVWKEVAPGSFELLVDRDGAVGPDAGAPARVPVLKITRRYQLMPGTHVVRLHQLAENLSDAAIDLRLEQFGPIEMAGSTREYGGDKRRFRFGYVFPATIDPGRSHVQAADFLWAKQRVLGSASKQPSGVKAYEGAKVIWPNDRSLDRGYSPAWVATTGRHFASAVFPIWPAGSTDRAWTSLERVERVLLDPAGADPVTILKLTPSPVRLAPGATSAGEGQAGLGLDYYVGSLSKREIPTDAVASSAGLGPIVVYNFGGFCGAYCTFAPVALLLEWLMHALHDYVAFDWSIAIILLVVCVRSILHPVTRWSQVRMQRFAKQMQDLAPKMKDLQARYATDKAKLQAETQRLYREEGMNPAGVLGCLPMFLVMPIWIALYALLYFAFELRHEPAFFGLVQAITGGAWHFLADLSEPDAAIPLGSSFHIPLLSGLMGPVTSINLLPLILGVVFFVHQKYLTPPSPNLTPEQKQQQAMVKVISVVMFPLFMYNAPCGLSLYFITNSALAIVESRWIRAHIEKHKLLEVKRTPRKPGSNAGFLARLQQAAEARAKAVEQARKRSGK